MTKLFIEFDEPPVGKGKERAEPGSSTQPNPFTGAQLKEGNGLVERLTRMGCAVDTSNDTTLAMIEDARRWIEGAEAIEDIEARVSHLVTPVNCSNGQTTRCYSLDYSVRRIRSLSR